MKIISHRGFCDGIDKSIENKPSEIESRISEGFDVDIDWLLKLSNFLWIHCKSSESLNFLSRFQKLNYFFHDSDQYTITSKGFIWCYPGTDVIDNSVYLFPEKFSLSSSTIKEHNLSICTDFPRIYKEKSFKY